jgi:biopolymer transport protein ExbD
VTPDSITRSMRFYTRSHRTPMINIVSLIDILCLLLIFFVVTTTFREPEPEVKINLPETTQGTEVEQETKPLVIFVTQDSKIYLGEEQVPISQLSAKLKIEKEKMTRPIFALKADEGVPLGFFVKVLDASKEAGVEGLSFYTEKPEAAAP